MYYILIFIDSLDYFISCSLLLASERFVLSGKQKSNNFITIRDESNPKRGETQQ